MLVSWNWLKDYVDLPMSHAEATHRLMMAGLNHESTTPLDNDFCIDLEVTSNRTDCLGHIGVAREIAVLFGHTLRVPNPEAVGKGEPATALTRVDIECPQLCSRYLARVIRGVKIGPSPDWLAARLRTIGIAVINNVVDVTNYVMMECGQPLHAFDLARLAERRIIVREARAGEPFQAINHQTYALEPGMCVIADAQRPIALGGVMGGADTEVSDGTTELLIEAADFAQLSIRSTARKLKLHSPSSYRFERGVDREGLDWASRRCCALIVQLAGGTLAAGVVAAGTPPGKREPITLRLAQLERILGIKIAPERVHEILRDLGAEIHSDDEARILCVPPSWRRDLTREVDLIEEAARIHGYDKIPEDTAVPMAASHRSDSDRVMAIVRRVMNAAGFDEAMTASVVTPAVAAAFSPWCDAPALQTNQPMLEGADRVRVSLIPSLLESRQVNEARGNGSVDQFETAKVYLPRAADLPDEQLMLSAATGRDFIELKGVVESLLHELNPSVRLSVAPFQSPLLEAGQGVHLLIENVVSGVLGVVSAAGRKQLGLRGPATVFELRMAELERIARLVPQHQPTSRFPAMTRDLNLIVAEAIRWANLEATVRAAGGEALESVRYLDTYRDPAKDGPGRKRLLFSMSLRSLERTLTGDEVDTLRDRIVEACRGQLGATLLS
jgi:phenylalanyl-tRNA synthetase beta chain